MKLFDYLKSFLNKHHVLNSIHRQLILFLIVGSICFVIDMMLLVFMVEILKFEIVFSTGTAVILTTFVAYLLDVRFIFQKGKFNLSKEITLFFIFSIVGFLLNISLMYILTVYVMMWYVLAKILITISVAVFNFSTRKWLIFVR